jgi:hypothetical protein
VGLGEKMCQCWHASEVWGWLAVFEPWLSEGKEKQEGIEFAFNSHFQSGT